MSPFYINPAEPGSHSLLPGFGQKSYNVEVVTLDAYFSYKHYPPPNFVKIDVEGAEFRVLRGMKKILEQVKEIGIVVELTFKEYSFQDLKEFLSTVGLKPWLILDSGDVKAIEIRDLKHLRGANILLYKE